MIYRLFKFLCKLLNKIQNSKNNFDYKLYTIYECENESEGEND